MSVDADTRSRYSRKTVRLFLCGDVMTGRGIDQILPHPCEPTLYEPHVKDARRYWWLAEEAHGKVERPVDESYVWGEALAVWEESGADARIVNLETAVTRSDEAWPGKGIHYRMSPENVGCLTAARIDCCGLANNHVVDWGRAGLAETLDTLRRAGMTTCGAGRDRAEAESPAALRLPDGGRVLVFSFGIASSGIPLDWAATESRSGVNWLGDVSEVSAARAGEIVGRHRRQGDVVVASVHWGGNWGYEVDAGQRHFAHRLIDAAGVDVLHGHSSHHAQGIEVYRDRLILYGCGDFLTDYEGISGYEWYRGDLAPMYFADVDRSSGRLVRLQVVPLQLHRLRLRRTSSDDVRWLCSMLNREGQPLGTVARATGEGTLAVEWQRGG